MEHWKRDKAMWRFFIWLLGGWLRRKFNFTPEINEPEGPFLLLANHATDWDPLLTALSFPHSQMYFVASEHIFRWGLAYRLINWILHPISRMKGATASDTVMTIMRRMKKGANVALFAEGNRTWDGRTGFILPSTGKLARSCGGSLVTYKLTGGYFTSPRWAGKRLRRGRMHGEIVGVYTREQLRAMTPDEINAVINRDLHEDAYARQREDMVRYVGSDLAEDLETMLCVCPACGRAGCLSSSGGTLSCGECGAEYTYTELGFIEGCDRFDNIPDWDAWQTERLVALAQDAGEGVIFSDEGVTLTKVSDRHDALDLGSGAVTLRADALECCGTVMPLSEISGMGMHGNLSIDLTFENEYYEINAQRTMCLRKYMTIYEYLRRSAEKGKGTTETC